MPETPKKHILVVDDYPMGRMKTARMLTQQGYQVSTAENGLEALQAMEAQTFDAVLLDIVMPEMDGLEVLEKISHNDALSQIPIIVLSGMDETDTAEKCIALGAVDYLSKPIEAEILDKLFLKLFF